MPKLHFLPPRSRCTSSQCFHPIVVWVSLLCLFSIQYNFEEPFVRSGRTKPQDSGCATLASTVLVAILTSMLIAQPIILPRTSKLLYLPAEQERIHPLSRTMNLLFCQVSGSYSKVEIFQTQLQTLLSNPGGMEPRNNTQHICDSGKSTVVNKRLIPFHQLTHKA